MHWATLKTTLDVAPLAESGSVETIIRESRTEGPERGCEWNKSQRLFWEFSSKVFDKQKMIVLDVKFTLNKFVLEFSTFSGFFSIEILHKNLALTRIWELGQQNFILFW